MIEIRTEFGRFKATSQRLADQFRTITKNGWFSNLEILEIHQQMYRQTHEQIHIGKPETPNQTLHDNDSHTTNTQKQILTQEEETNVDAIKRIMSEKRTVKSETEKVNDLLTNIPTNDITELNDLIYAGAKLDSEKR